MAGRKKNPESYTEGAKNGESKFSKEQLLSSKHFRERRDILEALLAPGELYTVKTVEEMIESYMKGRVR